MVAKKVHLHLAGTELIEAFYGCNGYIWWQVDVKRGRPCCVHVILPIIIRVAGRERPGQQKVELRVKVPLPIARLVVGVDAKGSSLWDGWKDGIHAINGSACACDDARGLEPGLQI
jgi:hypothetical protein